MKRSAAAAVLAAILTVSAAIPAAAAAAPTESQVIQTVRALGIMAGDEQGNMNLSKQVTRAEFVTMAVKASPGGDRVGQASTSPYSDVPYTHWAAGFVEAGVQAGLISGYTDGTFRPDRTITLAEGVTIALNLLGYSADDFSGAYPTGQMALYDQLELDTGLTAQASGDVLTRRDAMYLFYNLMTADSKAGQPYLTTLGYSLNAAGEIDLVSLINAKMSGPVVAEDNWQASIPFSLEGASVQRNGSAARITQIQMGDVIYWNTEMRALWVYSSRVTGAIQALSPSASNPTSVTGAGRTYTIDTSQAAYQLSDLGSYGLGDTVTLLLGRNDGVAGVTTPQETQQLRCGVVTQTAQSSYPDGYGSTYLAETVTLLATDGNTYSYQWTDKHLDPGDLVQVDVSSQGEVTLSRLSGDSLSGKVSSDGSQIGSTPLAADVEILDVYENSGIRVYPDRLAGVTLSGDDVAYYRMNSQGEISHLILKDVTGDMHQYGVLTKRTTTPAGAMSSYYTYQYTLSGTPYVAANLTALYPVESGPVVVKGSPSAPNSILPLTSVKVDSIQGNQLRSGSHSYTLSDHLSVYQYQDGSYLLSTLDRVQELGLTLTGWYDQAETSGGRIRVIIAKD